MKKRIHFDKTKMLKGKIAQNKTYLLGKEKFSTLTSSSRIMKEFYLICLILEDIIELPFVDRLLEVGCGIGNLTSVLSSISNEIEALDHSDVGIQIAIENYGHLRNVRFMICDGTDPRKTEVGDQFDLIYFREFHPFTRDYYDSTGEMAKIHKIILQEYLNLLSPKGVIILKHSEKSNQTIRPEKLNISNADIVICRTDPRLVTVFSVLLQNRVKSAITISNLLSIYCGISMKNKYCM